MNLLIATLLSSLLAAGCASPQVKTEKGTLDGITQLTSGFDRAGEAYFSPDMKWIIFQATPKGEKNYQMYVAPMRWTPTIAIATPVRISPEPSKNTCGFFSPDGNSLLFASTAGKEPAAPITQLTTQPTTQATGAPGYQRSSNSYRWDFPDEMEIFRADGWEGAVQAAAGTHFVNLAKHPLTDNHAYDAECAYSPDGQWIVFTSNRTGNPELFAMRPDGSDLVQLTYKNGYDGGAFFSPDGKRLVYRSDRAGNDLLQIFTAEIVREGGKRDGGGKITGLKNERQLTRDKNVNWGPFWHPDGKHIIFASSAQGHQNYELYLMRSDGSHKIRITHTDGFDGLPVFSPDGNWLMWSSKRTADHTTQVFIARFTLPPGS